MPFKNFVKTSIDLGEKTPIIFLTWSSIQIIELEFYCLVPLERITGISPFQFEFCTSNTGTFIFDFYSVFTSILSKVSWTIEENLQTFRNTFYNFSPIKTMVLGPEKLPNSAVKWDA